MASDPDEIKSVPAKGPAGAADDEAPDRDLRFSPEEEASLLEKSNSQKLAANALYSSAAYDSAIDEYEKSLVVCPNYLDYEISVLRSNISACHINLRAWKAAVEAASGALDALDRLEGISKLPEEEKEKEKADGRDEDIEELVSPAAQKIASSKSLAGGHSRDDVQRIRAKALMRRAKARSEVGGWSALQGAEEDYKTLATMRALPPADMRVVQRALVQLPPRIEAAKQKEMAEMMGKLKEASWLGNGILKPFGLSTDSFSLAKDDATGGYSMQFGQGDKKQ
ncbi:MAG: hypothetical protein M1832_000502 [Thelocarpon impressellum]|nr:MAG: hypothetical protein M1832_000502 [Thelocarpon impressellum]